MAWDVPDGSIMLCGVRALILVIAPVREAVRVSVSFTPQLFFTVKLAVKSEFLVLATATRLGMVALGGLHITANCGLTSVDVMSVPLNRRVRRAIVSRALSEFASLILGLRPVWTFWEEHRGSTKGTSGRKRVELPGSWRSTQPRLLAQLARGPVWEIAGRL